ncbi:MAG TPA: anthranilate synthase component I [Terriglobales bacterium]|nr:anthranilate synthase component I [Terriglobales bacterium]
MASAPSVATSSRPASFAEVRRQAARYNVIPLTRTLLADLETPVAAYLQLASGDQGRYSYLLESVTGGEIVGRYSYIGWAPYRLLRQRQGRVEELRPPERRWKPLAEDLITAARAEVARRRLAPVEGHRFLAGAVGYLGYDWVRSFEKLPARAQDDLGVDEALLMFFSRQVIFDHVRRQMTLVACVMAEPGRSLAAEYARARRDLEAMERRLRRPPRLPRPARPPRRAARPRATLTPAQYQAAVRRAREYILAGDAFQIVLSQRWDRPTAAPPFQVYRALRTINPSPYMFYLQLDGLHLVGASPELLVGIEDREILYRPIAGTRPRGATPAHDEALEAELRTDAKERAEHVMLVDLGRNDVGRVAETGSVRVPRLMYVEKYSHVQHLVSDVRGRLARGQDLFDALRACFPAGTLTGAPKVRAMEIIEELEPTRRGAYGGAVLYLDFSGDLNACIAIRTILMRGGVAHVQAGAGIVADSRPEREHEECRNKAGALLRAIAMAEDGLRSGRRR